MRNEKKKRTRQRQKQKERARDRKGKMLEFTGKENENRLWCRFCLTHVCWLMEPELGHSNPVQDADENIGEWMAKLEFFI